MSELFRECSVSLLQFSKSKQIANLIQERRILIRTETLHDTTSHYPTALWPRHTHGSRENGKTSKTEIKTGSRVTNSEQIKTYLIKEK
jgi:hypothetical protein